MYLANAASETNRTPQHWKRKAAMAIGRPEMAESPDEDLEEAHDDHMEAVYATPDETADMANEAVPYGVGNPLPMPPGPASVVGAATGSDLENLQQRAAWINGQIRQIMHSQGLSYEQAFEQVSKLYPQYFKMPGAPAAVTRQQIANERARCENVKALVNAKMEQGCDYETAFASVRREMPHLFSSK
jgi:hypothetical protein